MSRVSRNLACILAVLTACLWPATGRASIHQVWDQGHFFQPETLLQMETLLEDIDSKFNKDLMIETFASIPDDLKPKVQEKGKEQFFEDWTMYEGSRLKVNGIIIVITGEPRHIQVAIGLDTRRKAFTEKDRDELVKILITAFSKKPTPDYDKGIIAAAEFVRDRMAKNLAEPPTTQSTTQSATQPSSLPTTRPATVSK